MVSSFSLFILMGAEVGWRRNKEGFGDREVTVFFLTIVIAEQVLEKKKRWKRLINMNCFQLNIPDKFSKK